MAQDYFKPKGRAKASKPDAGGGVIRSEPVFGVVKDNVDSTRSGRLQVYVADFGSSNPNDSKSWTTVSYMSPFYGKTTPSGPQTGYGTYVQNTHSYGVWNSPPDIGTTVICIFINGDMNYGFWIGCVPEAEALTMVPALGGVETIVPNAGEANSLGGSTLLPVTNMNTDNASIANSADYITAPKPVHSFQASIFAQQGLVRDSIRGPISSTAQRETPSRVGWGVSTPGRPIYKGGYTDANVADSAEAANSDKLTIVARRGGHSIVMDDGDLIGQTQLVRIRTALGHQITMSDDGQTLFIIHSNGQSYIELGKEGTIDMYATNSVNIRTQGDLNLHADRNVNINAAKALNISADSVNLTSTNNYSQLIGGDYKTEVSGKLSTKVGGTMSMGSAGEGSYASGSTMYVNGSVVNLNTGETSATPESVDPIPLVAHTDSLFDKEKGWAAAPGKLLSIVSRAPAHAPWANAGQGVDVQIKTDSAAALASPPSSNLAAANATTSATPDAPTSVATAATVPPVNAINAALDKNVTGAMVGGIASQASALAPDVVAIGAGTIKDAAGTTVAAAGAFAQTASQMETGGVLKPGAASLVNSLVQGGASVASAMTNNLFTGKAGAGSLTQFTNNIPAQAASIVTNLQSATSGLISTGAISGKEAPGQIGGAITAAVATSVGAVTDFIKGAASGSGIPASLSGIGDKLTSAMSSGNFAANMASTLTGGLNSLATSLGGMTKSLSAGLSGLVDSAKGLAGSAFSAITNSFKPLQSGVPQNLTAINKQNKEDAAKEEAGALPGVGGLLASAQAALPAGVSGALSSVAGTASSLASSASSAIASGVNALPGGQGAISAVVNQATGASPIPGIGQLSSVVKNVGTGVLNNIPGASAALSSVASLGTAGGGLSSLAGGLDIGGLASKITSGTQSLTSLLSSGLPAGAASQVSAGINALSSGTGLQIKLPVVGSATVDRSTIDSLTTSLLGDSKIPSPNFSGVVPASAVAALAALRSGKASVSSGGTTTGTSTTLASTATGSASTSGPDLSALADQQTALLKQLDEQNIAVTQAKAAYDNASQTLPQGDPAIQAAADAWRAEVSKRITIADQMSAVANQLSA